MVDPSQGDLLQSPPEARRTSLGDPSEHLTISPAWADASIQTGKRTMMEYMLLKPIVKTFRQILRER